MVMRSSSYGGARRSMIAERPDPSAASLNRRLMERGGLRRASGAARVRAGTQGLQPGHAQAAQAMPVDQPLPRGELLGGELIALAGLLEGEQAVAYRGHHLRLA